MCFQGFWVTLSQLSASFIYSSVYEKLRSVFTTHTTIESPQIVSAFAGGAASVVSASAACERVNDVAAAAAAFAVHTIRVRVSQKLQNADSQLFLSKADRHRGAVYDDRQQGRRVQRRLRQLGGPRLPQIGQPARPLYTR